jgi:hypothetical protein
VELSVTINADPAVGSLYSNGFIIFDFQSATNFKFAGAYTSTDQWVIGQRTSKGWITQASFTAPIDTGADYELTLVLQNDSHATLYIGGEAKVGCSFAESLTDGSLGLGTRNAVSHFDDLQVKALSIDDASTPGELPISEDFDDLLADPFAPEIGQWSISLGQYVATPDPSGDGVSLLDLTSDLPDDLQVSVLMNVDDVAGERFSNGFVIFDYQSPTDFKFAGGFAARNEWAIGHRTADGWITDAVVTGEIDPFADYELKIEIHDGNHISLAVGDVVVEHVFDESITDGELGLGSYNSVVRFDDFTIVDLTPHPTVNVEVHGNKLLISGDATSEVSIVATADNTVQVVQEGQVLKTFTSKSGNLHVVLGDGDDNVALDLGGLSALRHVTVDLGDGNNSLVLKNGSIDGHLNVVGGSGDDHVFLADDAVVERHARLKLFSGNDTLDVSGEIHRNLWFKGGNGDDQLVIDGTVNRHLFAHLGNGDDDAQVSPDATIGRFAFISLGKGEGSFYPEYTRSGHQTASKGPKHCRQR